MEQRVKDLRKVVDAAPPIDLKLLQLRLQGSICVQVNAGPLTYASTFLARDGAGAGEGSGERYPEAKVRQLRAIFRDFVLVCSKALQLNQQLICADQR